MKTIKEMGYNCRIIRYVKKDSLWRRIYIAPLVLISGGWSAYWRKKKKSQKNDYPFNYVQNLALRTKANNKWKDLEMEPLCDTYVGYEELVNGSRNYNLVLVGSDQVWAPLGLYSRFYNLIFVDECIPTMSYASSFGVTQIPWWQRRSTASFLKRIDAISVRELQGKQIVMELTGRDATVVCDPTLLRTREQWEQEFIGKMPKVENDYIFCYLLGHRSESRDVVRQLSKDTGLPVVAIRHTDEYIACDECFGDIALWDVDPIEFVQLISRATYVCTDSFHCSVFSIIFHRPFLTFYRFASTDRNSRNSRIDSLLSLTGLTERLYHSDITKEIQQTIDYHSVDLKINQLRNLSMGFLKKGLKQAI